MNLRIAVDLMGSDTSPLDLFEGVLQACQKLPFNYTYILLVTHDVETSLQTKIKELKLSQRIHIQVIQEVISMTESPLTAIRHKKNSSIVKGIHLIKDKNAEAFISAGSTGALVAASTIILPLLPGIERPGLLALIPTKNKPMAVLDVGGNVSVKPAHLVQFALMGAAYQRCCEQVSTPRIGLLNIGTESKKGTDIHREAYQLLSNLKGHKLEFAGNVEGREVFEGNIEVIVTDGFSGNLFLKTCEGLSSFIIDVITKQLGSYSHELKNEFVRVQTYFDYAEYRGATLCGVEGIVIKCHGYSNSKAMFHAIKGATDLLEKDFVHQIKQQLL
jgi:glycerol-3-phosphate acyltransferase PlsX